MPVAAYEVTGLGIGRFESVYEEHIIDEDGYDNGIIPLIRLTPGENTFVLFCIPGDPDEVVTGDWDSLWAYVSLATIHSPSGSGLWEATTYTSRDMYIPETEGFSSFTRAETGYNEETYDAHIDTLLDVWLPV